MNEKEIKKIVDELKFGKFKQISKEKISESNLQIISEKLKEEENFDINELISIILLNNINENCDWNIGSIFNILIIIVLLMR